MCLNISRMSQNITYASSPSEIAESNADMAQFATIMTRFCNAYGK